MSEPQGIIPFTDNIRDLSDLRTPVSDGDVLLVIPSISGG